MKAVFRSPVRLAGLLVLTCLILWAFGAPSLCSKGPFDRVGLPLLSPRIEYWLGTDDLGRSMACLAAFGLRTSIWVGIGVSVLSVLIGVVVGVVAGFFGGVVDLILSRIIASVQVVPRFFLAIMIAAFFGPTLFAIIAILGLTSWPLIARLVRVQVLSLRQCDFVVAAISLQLSRTRILFRHVLPGAISPVSASVAVLVGGAISTEAALGFIGLSDGRQVSLGKLIAEGYPFIATAPWLSVVPVAVLVLIVLSIQVTFGSPKQYN